MGWSPLINHTHYSLQDATCRPDKLMKRAASLGYGAVAMTDHANVGCCVDFAEAAEKQGINPILGCNFFVCKNDATIKGIENGRPYSHMVVLAKNYAGWKQLIRAVSFSNSKEAKYHGPRINLDRFSDYAQGGNLIAMSGHPYTDLANALFTMPKAAYCCMSYERIKTEYLRPQVDTQKDLIRLAEQYISIFGKENFFLEVQELHPDSMPAQSLLSIAMRWLSKRMGIPTVATNSTHYVTKQDQYDHLVLLSGKPGLKCSVRKTPGLIEQREMADLIGFARSKEYHLPSTEEMARYHTHEEIEQAGRIAEMCDKYSILRNPILPPFPCPSGMDANAYLEHLCEKGWKDKIDGYIDRPEQEYRDRLNMELGVVREAGLSGYFLIVQDFMNYGRGRGWLLGPGRGSGAGCLISYLTGITGIDPIIYGLIFERFYNAGRNKPGHISFPDIDCDFPIDKREFLFHYLQKKYGHDKVAKVATFSSLKGRGALKEVFRAREVNNELANRITKVIPDPAKITEELEEMRQRGEEPSIIAYTLDVYNKELQEWVVEQPDGTLEGDFADHFALAMRLEGVKKGIGTHAGGVVISDEPLANNYPMDYDEKNDQYRVAMEYTKLEKAGGLKFDILGVAALSKGEAVRDLVLTGEIHEYDEAA